MYMLSYDDAFHGPNPVSLPPLSSVSSRVFQVLTHFNGVISSYLSYQYILSSYAITSVTCFKRAERAEQ